MYQLFRGQILLRFVRPSSNNRQIITACPAESWRDLNSTLHWDKLSDIDVRLYKRQTERGFNNLNIPDGMKYSDHNCQNPSHINDIDSFYDDIFNVLTERSESLANVNSTRQRHNVGPTRLECSRQRSACSSQRCIFTVEDRGQA